MEAFVVTWRELLIVVVAILAIYVAELLLLLRWSGSERLRWWRRRASTSAEGSAVDPLMREIADLRRQMVQLQGEVQKLQAGPAPSVSPYNQAIQMARQGAGAAEVASGCHISRGEAELIVALYRKLRI
ncbi:MAG TPA: DUF2802 domain-containing protein [Burkholderiales bacterium]|nr:DUF2802 domain-containing protein [Burkholderiales bacterium]